VTPTAPTADDQSTVFARGTAEMAPIVVDAPSPVEELAALEDKLDRTLSTLQMHYQLIVHAHDRSRFGYEALLRSGDQSLPDPFAVLDAAERLEKMQKVGRAVRGQIAQLFADAPGARGYVFLNVHANDFDDKQLVSAFAPLSKIAHRVILEISERASLEAKDEVRYRIAELRELGFKIAIDDLGADHALLGDFALLDTEFVKLDMSLVRGIDCQPAHQDIVKALTELCRSQGARVIAEGVETEAEASTLVELGCDLLQGFVIAKPALPFSDAL
jgi:EAL domain-containing protein (putative c-di-GMP-specific phosphodiesterase class I)